MNELFGQYNRPKAEIKHIEKILIVFEKSREEYKSKNYIEALELLNSSYELLTEIWDQYPKILTLYLIMKSHFYLKQYNDCELIKQKLDDELISIYKDKRDAFFKIKSKIFLYDLIINFINDNLNESINSILDIISYISTNEEMTLEEKVSFFWRYIKGILKLIGKEKTTKYILFKNDYDSMLFMDAIIKKDAEDKIIPVQKINKSMIDEYKSFFNFKLRQEIYEYLDKEFYFVKYGKRDDKLMNFLQKNMETYVRKNNKQKLIEDLKTYVNLNKIDVFKEFGLNELEIIHEQKRRIDSFDTIFYNLIGAFSHIFKDYFSENNNELDSKKYKPKNEKQKSDIKELLIRMNKRNSMENFKIRELKKIEENKNNNKIDFKKEILIPKNDEEMDKILLTNIRNKYKYNQSKMKSHFINTNNYNFSKLDKSNKHNKSFNFFTHNNLISQQKTNTNKTITNNKLIQKPKKLTKEDFIFRNINNFLINKIISIFTPIFKIQNGIQTDPITELEYVPILPKKSDLINLNYPNLIKSYYALSNKGTRSPENQDTFFYYDNFLLIKNCILFGVCDGHGKNGGKISHLVSALFPSYIFYIILDDNSIRRKQDTNELMLKLFKFQESPEHSKKVHFLRYIMNKLGVETPFIPFVSGNETSIFNLLFESVHLCHKALQEKFNIDIDYSGTTLCSGIIVGNKLYISNIGDSTAILGIFNNKGNTWKHKLLSVNHVPELSEENKRIIQNNGKIERLKNQLNEEYGPFRVFDKDSDSLPGLAISRSVGDEKAKKIGVVYEPELFVYNLRSEHRIIIVGSDGLWNNINYDEAIQIAGKVYDEGRKVDEAVHNLMEIAKKNWMENAKRIRKKEKEKNAANKSKNIMDSSRKDKIKFDGDDNNDVNVNIKKERNSMDDITCLVIFLKE
jgi:serine/threonine protein phosphatase PrpC